MAKKAIDSRNKYRQHSTVMWIPGNGNPAKVFRIASPLKKFLSFLMIFIFIIVSQVIMISYFIRENAMLAERLAQSTRSSVDQHAVLSQYILRQADLLEHKADDLETLIADQAYLSSSLMILTTSLEYITSTYLQSVSEVTPASLDHRSIGSFIQNVTSLSQALDTIYELSQDSNNSTLNFQAARSDLMEFLDDVPSFWPTVSRRIASPFGMRFHPILRIHRMHEGVDLGGAIGDNIYAAASGTVIRTAFDSGLGHYLIIDHTGGITTLYAHCSRILVREGNIVRKGQVIARVGNTGLSSSPHLHFEVRVNNVPVNPLLFIRQ